ncbi:MAG: glycosyltransferase family 2 protein [bacterium]
MENIPVFSVIMPLYNKRPYVKRAIESVQRQTFTNWELIIVDDGSTDSSTDEIPQGDSRIRIFCQENKGPAAARNKGIMMASGDFITFLDADDYYYTQKLEIEMSLLWKEQKAEWMISAFEYESGNELRIRYVKDINSREIKGQPYIFNNALKQLTVAGWHVDGLCIRKKLLEDVGGFNENMRCYEITEFMIRCALKQPEVIIYPQPLYRVVDVSNSAFKMSPHRIEGERQKGESFYKLSKDYPQYSNQLIFKSQKALFSYVALLILFGKNSEARRYLINNFPYPRCKKWWKMLIGSYMPRWLIQRILSTNKSEWQ